MSANLSIRLAGAALVLAVLSACSGPMDLENAPPWEPPTTTTEPTTTTLSASTSTASHREPTVEHTENLLNTLVEMVDEWNAQALDFVTAYSSDEVGYDEFLVVAHDVRQAQARTIVSTRSRVAQLPSPLREAAEPLLDHYNDRLSLYGELVGAIVQGDDAEFVRIGSEYSELTDTTTLLPILEALFTHPVVAAYFVTEGVDAAVVLDALVGVSN